MNPRSWDQHNWWCGTSGCYAGHALIEAGYTEEQLASLNDRSHRGEDGDYVINGIAARAQIELAISDDEAALLFDMDNTYEMLEWMVSDIKGGTTKEWNDYAEKAGIL